jgi:hypothetical protein
MPTYYQEVEAEIEVTPSDFYSECSDSDINELIELLKEDGYLDGRPLLAPQNSSINYDQHVKLCNSLIENYYRLSNEDLLTLTAIANKF